MFNKFISFISTLAMLCCKPSAQGVAGAKNVILKNHGELWGQLTIPVCWESTVSKEDKFKDDEAKFTVEVRITEEARSQRLEDSEEIKVFKREVEAFVKENIGKTIVKLVGWSGCQTLTPGIHIYIYDNPQLVDHNTGKILHLGSPNDYKVNYRWFLDAKTPGHPRVRHFGRALDGKFAGVILTYNFTDVRSYLLDRVVNLTENGKMNVRKGIALHEFGHALGLRHEDSNPQRTCNDYAEDIGEDEVTISTYDPDSMMSRCLYRNYDNDKGPVEISKGDIEAINNAYRHLLLNEDHH